MQNEDLSTYDKIKAYDLMEALEMQIEAWREEGVSETMIRKALATNADTSLSKLIRREAFKLLESHETKAAEKLLQMQS